LPKRLINIGSSTESLRLITPSQGTAYKYALLSYCWGGEQAGKTMRSNLQLYQTSIPTHSLSASIRDAIAVTRILGFEYLWVDSLCMPTLSRLSVSHTDRFSTLGIVQDDAEELTMEISKQARIFQNSAVTILAGGARSAEQGFLQKRQKRQSCRINCLAQMSQRWMFCSTSLNTEKARSKTQSTAEHGYFKKASFLIWLSKASY
jgi:hypothetical protein